MKWTKLWSGATSSGDTVSATLADNRKIRATFGFSTKVTVKGKGKVVDNRNPKKIVCENTVPNTTKVCRDSYSATNLKFTASTTDANYQFTGWTSDPKSLCSGTNAVCNLGNRCANLALVANFGAPPVSEPSCNVTPTTGVTPLVIKLNATNQQAGETYKFVVTGNTSPAFSKEVPQNSASPVFFTAPYVGTYTVSLVGSTGWSTNDCPAITVSSPTSGGGGEVAP